MVVALQVVALVVAGRHVLGTLALGLAALRNLVAVIGLTGAVVGLVRTYTGSGTGRTQVLILAFCVASFVLFVVPLATGFVLIDRSCVALLALLVHFRNTVLVTLGCLGVARLVLLNLVAILINLLAVSGQIAVFLVFLHSVLVERNRLVVEIFALVALREILLMAGRLAIGWSGHSLAGCTKHGLFRLGIHRCTAADQTGKQYTSAHHREPSVSHGFCSSV